MTETHTYATLLLQACTSLAWHDYVEIALFTLAMYRLTTWLSKSHDGSLLINFYLYGTISITSYLLDMTTLWLATIYAFPLLCTWYALVHQKTLQKAYLSLRHVDHNQNKCGDWLYTLVQCAITYAHKGHTTVCVIERNDSLEPFLKPTYPLNSCIARATIDVLHAKMADPHLQVPFTLWARQPNELVAVTPQWYEHDVFHHSDAFSLLPKHLRQAVHMTHATDACVFVCSPESCLFTIVIQGVLIDSLTTYQAYTKLSSFLENQSPSTRGGTNAFIPSYPFNRDSITGPDLM